MLDKKKIIGIIWLIILIFLWACYPFFGGDIFFWMWVAINWSILGCLLGAILFTESQKYEIILGVIWIVILVLLWVYYPYLEGGTLLWMWTAVIWSIIGNALYIGLFILKRAK